jgi:hypothetical protein
VTAFDPAVHVWCCFTHLFNILLGPISFRHDLEFHIPFALGSVSWSAVLTGIIVLVRAKLTTTGEKRHPNQAFEATS